MSIDVNYYVFCYCVFGIMYYYVLSVHLFILI